MSQMIQGRNSPFMLVPFGLALRSRLSHASFDALSDSASNGLERFGAMTFRIIIPFIEVFDPAERKTALKT